MHVCFPLFIKILLFSKISLHVTMRFERINFFFKLNLFLREEIKYHGHICFRINYLFNQLMIKRFTNYEKMVQFFFKNSIKVGLRSKSICHLYNFDANSFKFRQKNTYLIMSLFICFNQSFFKQLSQIPFT